MWVDQCAPGVAPAAGDVIKQHPGRAVHLGRLVVEQLLAAGVPAGDIIATGRATDKIKDLADRGVQVRVVDFVNAPGQGRISAAARADYAAAAHGALHTASGDLTALTGRPATTLSAAVGAALGAH